MIKNLLLLVLKLNRLSAVTSEGISFQLRILAHYDIANDGLKCNYEMYVFRRNPRANLPTIKYSNIQQAIDDVTARIKFYERKTQK